MRLSTKDNKRWQFVGRMDKGCHRFFRERTTGRTAVADESGDGRFSMGAPESTEDGVLWLDLEQTVHISAEGMRSNSVVLALTDDDGERTYTGESLRGALVAAKTFGLKVETDDDVLDLLVDWLAMETGARLQVKIGSRVLLVSGALEKAG